MMARYRLKTKMLIGTRLCAAGEVVEYDGEPGRNMLPLDEDAKAKVREKFGEYALTDKTVQKFNVGCAGSLWPIPRR